jgi:CRISPR-associated protein Csb2
LPWLDVVLVPLDRRIVERDRVRVAVAAPKALIKILDRDSPPVLTGAYPPGVRRPANRVALQVLDRDHPVNLPGEWGLGARRAGAAWCGSCGVGRGV